MIRGDNHVVHIAAGELLDQFAQLLEGFLTCVECASLCFFRISDSVDTVVIYVQHVTGFVKLLDSADFQPYQILVLDCLAAHVRENPITVFGTGGTLAVDQNMVVVLVESECFSGSNAAMPSCV